MFRSNFFTLSGVMIKVLLIILARVERLTAMSKVLGSETKENMVITRVISSLPFKFRHFHKAWDSPPDVNKNFDNLTSKLMAEELRLPEKKQTKNSSALIDDNGAKRVQKQAITSKSRTQQITSNNYVRPGHVNKAVFDAIYARKEVIRASIVLESSRFHRNAPRIMPEVATTHW